ncbi:hypothetical protein TVD_02845 [Thioalkalivibrio versutus]|uniref:Uncharacterized protein n=1 Tax=Thioalkalivibrio versutus TaxID=106634 RepID=A0A0G3FZH0_9GAMM|nr:hypothetical protein TVD_02845 [Thioalkalivibrio versutus]
MLFAELPWSDTVFLHSPDPGRSYLPWRMTKAVRSITFAARDAHRTIVFQSGRGGAPVVECDV